MEIRKEGTALLTVFGGKELQIGLIVGGLLQMHRVSRGQGSAARPVDREQRG